MGNGERFNNYHLGALVIAVGLLCFAIDGPIYSERRRWAVDPEFVGLFVTAIGTWTIVREWRRRRRDRGQR